MPKSHVAEFAADFDPQSTRPYRYNIATTFPATAVAGPDTPPLYARLADRFGATASFLCALHCAALPLIIAALPALGISFLASHLFERVFITFASLLALASLAFGYRRHRRLRAFGFLGPGIALLIAGIVIDLHNQPMLHAVLVSLGGSLVAIAHLANLRLGHVHVHDASCSHG
jgi:MFS family permease